MREDGGPGTSAPGGRSRSRQRSCLSPWAVDDLSGLGRVSIAPRYTAGDAPRGRRSAAVSLEVMCHVTSRVVVVVRTEWDEESREAGVEGGGWGVVPGTQRFPCPVSSCT